MAQVLGQSGRYVSEEARKQSDLITQQFFITIGILGVIEGLVVSSILPIGRLPALVRMLFGIAALGAMVILVKRSTAKLSQLSKYRDALRRGADGELQVGRIVSNLPDEFCVVNDLTTPFGNLDHVVVGPTGIFVLDAKNWRGVVSADGKGELLLNGKATDKPVVRPFVSRMMGIRDKVRTLSPGPDPYYKALLVFTAARVDANWGSTGKVHCVRDDQLHDYIVGESGTHLSPDEVERVAQAFLGLAHMDRGFTRPRPNGLVVSDLAESPL